MADHGDRIEQARWLAQESIRRDAVAAGSIDPWGEDVPPSWVQAAIERNRDRRW